MKKTVHPLPLILFSILAMSHFSFGQTKMIWADLYGKISKSNLDGSEKVVIFSTHVPYDLQIDSVTQAVYWTESGSNSLWKHNIASGINEKLYQSPEALYGLTIAQSKLYFVAASGIYKMNLDGTQLETALTVSNATDVVLVANQLFWTDQVNGKILKKNTSGSGNTTVFSSLAYPSNLIYNAADSKLYWSEYCGASICSGIRKGNPSGGTKQVVIDEFVEGFEISSSGNKIYCTDDIYDEIFSINVNGSGRTSLADITSSPKSIGVWDNKFYWFDLAFADYLYSSNLDGSNESVLASSPVYRPTRFAIDTVGKWLYWVNSPGAFFDDHSQAIKRARLDGSQVENVVAFNDLNKPYGIGLDLINQKLYWTDPGDHVVRRCNFDGSSVEDIVPDNGTFDSPRDIVVDAANNRIFWTDSNEGKVKTAELNGGQVTTLVSKLSYPWGIAYSAATDEVYFCEYGGSKTLQRMSSTGANRVVITSINDVFQNPNGLWPDPQNGYLYWTDDSSNKINRIGLDGTNNTVLLNTASGAGIPAGIQILPASALVDTKSETVNKMTVSPNPFSTVLTLERVSVGDRIVLTDIMGHTVLAHSSVAGNQIQLGLGDLQPGVYVLQVLHANGSISVQKVLKSR